MANYNTFVVIDSKAKKNILVTSSSRKANRMLTKGIKVEVWNNNAKIETIYDKTRKRFKPYNDLEKMYIGRKQKMG